MDQYKPLIEELVHPLHASSRRMNILRRELWAHFCALVDEALPRLGNETLAVEEALSRLGTATEIRRTFYESIPTAERICYALDRFVRRGDGEAIGRYAVRLFMVAASAYGVLSVFIVACVELLGRELSPPRWAMAIVLVGTMVAFATASLFGLMLRLNAIETRLRKATLAGRATRVWGRIAIRMAVDMVPVGLLSFACGYTVLGLSVGFRGSEVLEFAYITPPLIAMLWLQIPCVLSFAVLRDSQHAMPIADWPYTDA